MDRLDAMQLFVRVAELGSFAAVAQQMGVARSVVTRQIAGLEAHLGVKLMARSTRRLALTSAGSAYLEKCRVILNLVEAAEGDVAAERLTPRGQIRLSLPLSFGLKRLAPLLLEFSQRYPKWRSTWITGPPRQPDRGGHRPVGAHHPPARIGRRRPASAPAGARRRRAGLPRRHGRPRHPGELAHHECLGYSQAGSTMPWQFIVDGQPKPCIRAAGSPPTTARC
jgi:DNA-binding transcriptional LysR family regulator